jgi:hypothetical protein
MGVAWGFDGGHATDTRPTHVSAEKTWAKDESAPGQNDGTRLTASLMNRIVGNIRALGAAAGVALTETSDSDIANCVIAIAAAAPRTVGSLTDDASFVRMTVGERAKLAALAANYKGSFATLAALEAAYPTATFGDWAILSLPGAVATIAVWDPDVSAWVDIDEGVGGTAATIPFTPFGSYVSTNVQSIVEEIDGATQTALAGKAASSHGHAIADVTGLQTALDGKEPADADILKGDQTKALTAGYTAASLDKGSKSSGTFTPDPAERNIQHFTNDGAFTLAPFAAHTTLILDQINGASAGAITRTGFTKVTGDALTTTNGHKFRHFISVGQQGSHIHTQALQ